MNKIGVDELLLLLVKRYLDKNKMSILQALYRYERGGLKYVSLMRLSKLSGALLSYHLNGNSKGEGLVGMGLVEKRFDNKNMTSKTLFITGMGKDVLKRLKKDY